MLRAVAQGKSDPEVLAELAKGRLRDRLREKLPALRLALAGRMQPQQRQLIGELLDHIADLEQAIQRVEVAIAECLAVAEQEAAVQLLLTLPATGPVTAAA